MSVRDHRLGRVRARKGRSELVRTSLRHEDKRRERRSNSKDIIRHELENLSS